MLERLQLLQEAGLTGTMVIGDFVGRRISPLRQRERLACFYTGPDDLTRTFVGGKNPASCLLFEHLRLPGQAGLDRSGRAPAPACPDKPSVAGRGVLEEAPGTPRVGAPSSSGY